MKENEQIFEAATESIEEVVETTNLSGILSNKTFKKAALGIGIPTVVAGGVTAIVIAVRKNKDKIYNWMAEKLEKKGYTVLEPDFLDVNDENSNDNIRSEFEK